MSISRQEEIISALWLMAALLAKLIGWDTFSIVLLVKSGTDTLCAVFYALKEILNDKGASK